MFVILCMLTWHSQPIFMSFQIMANMGISYHGIVGIRNHHHPHVKFSDNLNFILVVWHEEVSYKASRLSLKTWIQYRKVNLLSKFLFDSNSILTSIHWRLILSTNSCNANHIAIPNCNSSFKKSRRRSTLPTFMEYCYNNFPSHGKQ